MQRYDRKTVVVKFGGHAMGDAELAANFAARARSCCGVILQRCDSLTPPNNEAVLHHA